MKPATESLGLASGRAFALLSDLATFWPTRREKVDINGKRDYSWLGLNLGRPAILSQPVASSSRAGTKARGNAWVHSAAGTVTRAES